MMQYRPCKKQKTYQVYEVFEQQEGEGTSVEKLNALFERVYNGGIIKYAQEHNLPLIDLTRSFDIND